MKYCCQALKAASSRSAGTRSTSSGLAIHIWTTVFVRMPGMSPGIGISMVAVVSCSTA
jgi:hypothetical protein